MEKEHSPLGVKHLLLLAFEFFFSNNPILFSFSFWLQLSSQRIVLNLLFCDRTSSGLVVKFDAGRDVGESRKNERAGIEVRAMAFRCCVDWGYDYCSWLLQLHCLLVMQAYFPSFLIIILFDSEMWSRAGGLFWLEPLYCGCFLNWKFNCRKKRKYSMVCLLHFLFLGVLLFGKRFWYLLKVIPVLLQLWVRIIVFQFFQLIVSIFIYIGKFSWLIFFHMKQVSDKMHQMLEIMVDKFFANYMKFIVLRITRILDYIKWHRKVMMVLFLKVHFVRFSFLSNPTDASCCNTYFFLHVNYFILYGLSTKRWLS